MSAVTVALTPAEQLAAADRVMEIVDCTTGQALAIVATVAVDLAATNIDEVPDIEEVAS